MKETNLLKEKYPKYYNNGWVYAETFYNNLTKYENKGFLKQIIGFDELPEPDDINGISNLIEKKAIVNASNLCIRDLNESNYPNPKENLYAFLFAFKINFESLLKNVNSINKNKN